MFTPNKKGQYALRAVYELAKRKDQAPVKISEIADAQAIPLRFLEVILNQLKGSGLVMSKRGFYGGYTLARPPEQITVGDILQYMQRRDAADAKCLACVSQKACPFIDNCVFAALWQKAKAATYTVYNATTLQDLLDGNTTDLAAVDRIAPSPASSAKRARQGGSKKLKTLTESTHNRHSKWLGKDK